MNYFKDCAPKWKIHFNAFQMMPSSGDHFTFETPETKIREEGREKDSGYHEDERLLRSTPRYFTARARRPTKLQFSSEKQKRHNRGPVTLPRIYLKLLQYSVREGKVQDRKFNKHLFAFLQFFFLF